MSNKLKFLLAAAFVTAGILSGCGEDSRGEDPSGEECLDANANGICDDKEQGTTTCAANEISVADACQKCPAGQVNNGKNVCAQDAGCPSGEVTIGGKCCVDADGDGFCADIDCNDDDPLTYPGAPELCGKPKINNCNTPCYLNNSCDDDQIEQKKRSRVAEVVGTTWTDVTEAVSQRGQAYETTQKATLYFCGAGPFDVNLRATGPNADLTIANGMVFGSRPRLSAGQNNRPVVTVTNGATLDMTYLTLEHSSDFRGDAGSGLHCHSSSVTFNGVTLYKNWADQGAGAYVHDCDLTFTSDNAAVENEASEGSAFYFVGGSVASASEGTMTIRENMVSTPDSAAIHVQSNSHVRWDSGPTPPTIYFENNKNTTVEPRDIRVLDRSTFDASSAVFSNGYEGRIILDGGTEYPVVGTKPISCTSAQCTF